MCLYSLCTAGQLWHFSVTTAGTSVRAQLGTEEQGLSGHFLFARNRGRKCSWLLHHSPQTIT